MAYRCAHEQVMPNVTGHLFRTAAELATLWRRLLAADGTGDERGYGRELRAMVGNVADKRVVWHDQWRTSMPAVLERASGQRL